MLDTINLQIGEITTEILRNYLADYKSNSKAGMRVGKITRLNILDMNFQERSCIVLGKGNSERERFILVQKLLGHIKIDTTMEYAMVNQTNVKNSHRKYIT